MWWEAAHQWFSSLMFSSLSTSPFLLKKVSLPPIFLGGWGGVEISMDPRESTTDTNYQIILGPFTDIYKRTTKWYKWLEEPSGLRCLNLVLVFQLHFFPTHTLDSHSTSLSWKKKSNILKFQIKCKICYKITVLLNLLLNGGRR